MQSGKTTPPKFARKLLLAFLRGELAEEVLGDLEEKFYSLLERRSAFWTKINYWYQVFNYARPFAIRKPGSHHLNQFPMFRNNLKIGWRNLLKNKGYAAINIGGLAIGMAVAVMIGLWVYDELSFNSFHKNLSRIGVVLRNGTLNGVTFTTRYLPYPLAEEIRTSYGDSFKHVLTAWPAGDHIVSAGELTFTKNGEFIEPGAPEMFTFKMLEGTWKALADQQSIVISASLANVLFGEKDPMGQSMRIDNKMDVKVTGVYQDLPSNSHFSGVDFFAPWNLFVSFNPWITNQGFSNNFLDVYVEIQPNTNFERASNLIRKTILNNVGDNKEFASVNPEIFLHPMKKWHLYSEWENGVNTGGLIQYVWLFGIVGAFVLLLACINFMNLSTARSEKRSKEVGIRKAIGSVRRQLIVQFFTESFIVVLAAFAMSLLIVSISLGWFNELAGKHIVMPMTNPVFWLFSIVFMLLTGLAAGSYPALYLSSLRPVSVLKGTFRAGRLASAPRRILVVVQFTVSISLAIGTLVVYRQIAFVKDRPVGYDQDGLLMIPVTSDYEGKLETVKTELKNTNLIEDVAESMSPVTGVWSSNGGFDWRGKTPGVLTDFATLDVSCDYGKTIGWEFVSGRDFTKDKASDSSALIINEAAAELMGFEDPIDEVVTWEPGWRKGATFRILGVVKDMVMRSPFDPPMPTVFFLSDRVNWLNIRIRPGVQTKEALVRVEAVLKRIVPAVPFDYTFADQEYALKFAAEERIGKLSAVFAVLAILISCLGLSGLASFVAAQRTKEIGIRKVVGASVYSLWKMLSRDFVIMVFLSCFMALPISWYVLSSWLSGYSYHTQISWWVFACAVTGSLIITVLTVSYQAIKAARMNPVTSLRSE